MSEKLFNHLIALYIFSGIVILCVFSSSSEPPFPFFLFILSFPLILLYIKEFRRGK